jgi:hypothetical protein
MSAALERIEFITERNDADRATIMFSLAFQSSSRLGVFDFSTFSTRHVLTAPPAVSGIQIWNHTKPFCILFCP